MQMIRSIFPCRTVVFLTLSTLLSFNCTADGIDKIYDPYVETLKTEVEWFGLVRDDGQSEKKQIHKLGVGKAVGEKWFVEGYVHLDNLEPHPDNDRFDVDAVEMEIKWQITEQGEYKQDWGLLLELEDSIDDDFHEFSSVILIAQQFDRWVVLANVAGKYLWGKESREQAEAEMSTQIRYRLQKSLEPAIELHIADSIQAIGPQLGGDLRMGIGKTLHWEMGFFFDMSDPGKKRTFKAGLEYEF